MPIPCVDALVLMPLRPRPRQVHNLLLCQVQLVWSQATRPGLSRPWQRLRQRQKTKPKVTCFQVLGVRGILRCEPPSLNLNRFNGSLHLLQPEGERVKVGVRAGVHMRRVQSAVLVQISRHISTG